MIVNFCVVRKKLSSKLHCFKSPNKQFQAMVITNNKKKSSYAVHAAPSPVLWQIDVAKSKSGISAGQGAEKKIILNSSCKNIKRRENKRDPSKLFTGGLSLGSWETRAGRFPEDFDTQKI